MWLVFVRMLNVSCSYEFQHRVYITREYKATWAALALRKWNAN